jgi:triphosphatase
MTGSPQSAPGTARETEWQFDALDLRPVRRWLEGRDPAASPAVGRPALREIADRYLDTEDWRMWRAGYALRLRDQDGGREATLKSMSPPVEERRDRVEHSQPVGGDTELAGPRGPVGARVGALAGSRPLRPLFEVRTRREVFPLSADGRPVGEVALDDTAVPLPGEEAPARLLRVEVEVDAEAVDAVRPFVEDLRAACGLRPAEATKLETGLLARGLTPPGPPDVGPQEVGDSLTIGEAAFAAMRPHFASFLAHEPGARLGEDPEEVHDMRVAIRRLRAALALFREALPVRGEALRGELKWVAEGLGEVRDLDVQLEQVRTWRAEMPEEDGRALEPVVTLLHGRRAGARRRLLRRLDSRRYERLVASLTAFLKRGPVQRSAPARIPVLAAAPDLLRRRYRRVRKAGDPITESSPPEDYHRLRIRGKRLRYALEFLEPLYGKRARRLIRRLVALQDNLGEHQDALVAVAHIRDLVAERADDLPPRALFVLGRIAERYERQAAERRLTFPAAYRRVRGKRWKALRREMGARRQEAGAPPEPGAGSGSRPERTGPVLSAVEA